MQLVQLVLLAKPVLLVPLEPLAKLVQLEPLVRPVLLAKLELLV